jgi:hypothetical protein
MSCREAFRPEQLPQNPIGVSGHCLEALACTASPFISPNSPRGELCLGQSGENMTKPTEEQIRQRAQEIWEENHRPTGRDDEFWHQAEKELNEEPVHQPAMLPAWQPADFR